MAAETERSPVNPAVRLIPLGGLGEIGRNCACVEVDGRILLLDVGLMFPELDMLGVDLVLPDFTYLRDNADRPTAIITHGHEDPWAASASCRGRCPPIYGSALTRPGPNRIEEASPDRTQLIPVRTVSGAASVRATPSSSPSPAVPRLRHRSTRRRARSCTRATSSPTTPVDGRLTDLPASAPRLGRGVRLLLSDRPTPTSLATPAASLGGQGLYDLFHEHEGRRIVIACFASHIHRVQQIADAAMAFGRKVATLGLSMKKNVRLARDGLLRIPDHALSTSTTCATCRPARCA
jgi:ribonuclease J